MESLRTLRTRIEAAAGKLPSTTRVARVCVVTSDDPVDIRAAKLAEAAREGDPVLEVVFYEVPSEPGEVAL